MQFGEAVEHFPHGAPVAAGQRPVQSPRQAVERLDVELHVGLDGFKGGCELLEQAVGDELADQVAAGDHDGAHHLDAGRGMGFAVQAIVEQLLHLGANRFDVLGLSPLHEGLGRHAEQPLHHFENLPQQLGVRHPGGG